MRQHFSKRATAKLDAPKDISIVDDYDVDLSTLDLGDATDFVLTMATTSATTTIAVTDVQAFIYFAEEEAQLGFVDPEAAALQFPVLTAQQKTVKALVNIPAGAGVARIRLNVAIASVGTVDLFVGFHKNVLTY